MLSKSKKVVYNIVNEMLLFTVRIMIKAFFVQYVENKFFILWQFPYLYLVVNLFRIPLTIPMDLFHKNSILMWITGLAKHSLSKIMDILSSVILPCG